MFYMKNKAFHKLDLLKSSGEKENLSAGSVRKIKSVQGIELALYNRPSE